MGWGVDNREIDLDASATNIRKCLAQGLYIHSAYLLDRKRGNEPKTLYTMVHKNHKALLEPGSNISRGDHQWIVYSSASYASRPYLHTATVIDPEWIKVSVSINPVASPAGPYELG